MPITISGSGITMQGTGITITGAIGTVAVIDLYFPYVTLLLSGDGTNAAQNNTFTDSSTNNFTVTRSGTPTQGTFTPFGSNWSNYFNGSTDYSTTPYNISTVQWWDTDYTIEMWVYNTVNAQSSQALPLQMGYGDPLTATTYWSFGTNSSGNLLFYYFNGSTVFTAVSSSTVPLNSWNHVAMVYTNSSTTLKGYINGVLAFSVAKSGTPQGPSGYTVNIGSVQNGKYTGYISNVRIVRGTAVYTSAFTPPTAPLTAVANTSLLTCQSNRFKDNSTNTFAVTVAGSPSVQRFSPFNPSSAYSTTVIGGSGYFNGTSDYLTAPTGAVSSIGTGAFTIEGWFYSLDFTIRTTYFQRLWSFGNGLANDVTLNVDTSGIISYRNNDTQLITASSAVQLNTWYHVAIVRSGSTTTMYINGVSVGTTATSNNLTSPGGYSLYIGNESGSTRGGYFIGYVSNFRVVQGTAVYTTTFTPPTSPVTAVANTSLLTNFADAGIYDSSEMNDVITAGSTQISTSVKKYGTASISFAGAGNYLSMPASGGLNFGTGDFTIETWVYFNSLANLPFLFQKMSGTTGWFIEVGASTVYFGWGSASSSQYIAFSASLSTGAWYHIAVTRTGSTLNAFVNGTSLGSQTLASANLSYDNSVNATIGGFYAGTTTYDLNGYIDDFRITRGYVRYPSNFTAPTATLPTQ